MVYPVTHKAEVTAMTVERFAKVDMVVFSCNNTFKYYCN